MLAFDIMNQVIEKDKLRKVTKGLGTTVYSDNASSLGTVVGASAALAAGYAMGNYVLEGKNAPEGFGRETTWGPTIGVGLASPILGALVSSILLPSAAATDTDSKNTLGSLISMAEGAANIYHGYKRHNESIAWAIGWGVFGNAGYAVSQGFAKPIVKR